MSYIEGCHGRREGAPGFGESARGRELGTSPEIRLAWRNKKKQPDDHPLLSYG